MRSAEDVIIRCENGENAEERSVIRSINVAAFGALDEADLVDKLRIEEDALISLVAELKKRIVGHVLFSRMWIETPSGLVRRWHWPLRPCCPNISIGVSVDD